MCKDGTGSMADLFGDVSQTTQTHDQFSTALTKWSWNIIVISCQRSAPTCGNGLEILHGLNGLAAKGHTSSPLISGPITAFVSERAQGYRLRCDPIECCKDRYSNVFLSRRHRLTGDPEYAPRTGTEIQAIRRGCGAPNRINQT